MPTDAEVECFWDDGTENFKQDLDDMSALISCGGTTKAETCQECASTCDGDCHWDAEENQCIEIGKF